MEGVPTFWNLMWSLFCKHRCQSHGAYETGKANRLLFRDVHGELKLSECITCGVCKTTFHNDFYSCSGAYTHSQTLNVFVFIFLVYLPFFSCMAKLIFYNLHTTVCSEWSGLNGSNFSNFCYSNIFFFQKKINKKIPGYKESLFVLNHLIHIFSIYMYYIYIYMITLFWRGRSVRLIRLERRSLTVGG